jgi:hypothetical protein
MLSSQPQAVASPVDILQGCYNAEKLLDTLNMTSNFQFTSGLNFSSLTNYDSDKIFNFSSFLAVRNEMKQRTPVSTPRNKRDRDTYVGVHSSPLFSERSMLCTCLHVVLAICSGHLFWPSVLAVVPSILAIYSGRSSIF